MDIGHRVMIDRPGAVTVVRIEVVDMILDSALLRGFGRQFVSHLLKVQQQSHDSFGWSTKPVTSNSLTGEDNRDKTRRVRDAKHSWEREASWILF